MFCFAVVAIMAFYDVWVISWGCEKRVFECVSAENGGGWVVALNSDMN